MLRPAALAALFALAACGEEAGSEQRCETEKSAALHPADFVPSINAAEAELSSGETCTDLVVFISTRDIRVQCQKLFDPAQTPYDIPHYGDQCTGEPPEHEVVIEDYAGGQIAEIIATIRCFFGPRVQFTTEKPPEGHAYIQVDIGGFSSDHRGVFVGAMAPIGIPEAMKDRIRIAEFVIKTATGKVGQWSPRHTVKMAAHELGGHTIAGIADHPIYCCSTGEIDSFVQQGVAPQDAEAYCSAVMAAQSPLGPLERRGTCRMAFFASEAWRFWEATRTLCLPEGVTDETPGLLEAGKCELICEQTESQPAFQ